MKSVPIAELNPEYGKLDWLEDVRSSCHFTQSLILKPKFPRKFLLRDRALACKLGNCWKLTFWILLLAYRNHLLSGSRRGESRQNVKTLKKICDYLWRAYPNMEIGTSWKPSVSRTPHIVAQSTCKQWGITRRFDSTQTPSQAGHGTRSETTRKLISCLTWLIFTTKRSTATQSRPSTECAPEIRQNTLVSETRQANGIRLGLYGRGQRGIVLWHAEDRGSLFDRCHHTIGLNWSTRKAKLTRVKKHFWHV